MNEFELIAQYFKSGDGDALLGIGDDAAIIPAGEAPLTIAVDTLVDGRHFPHGSDPASIGHRALAVNLSDLAAMGATPRYCTLALTLPEFDADWLSGFSKAMLALAARYQVQLIGGDTTRGPLTVTVQVIGCQQQPAMRRSGARPGDLIAVSGHPGDAAAGLRRLLQDERPDTTDVLAQRFLFPEPRVALGQQMAGQASAAIDISDGLLADLGHIAAQSRCGAVIDATRLPLSPALLAAHGRAEAEMLALSGGDDYELCFTLPADGDVSQWPLVTVIGHCEQGDGVRVINAHPDTQTEYQGYQHFG